MTTCSVVLKKILILSFFIMLSSCNKDKIKTVHYQLSGSYSGKLTVNYSGENGVFKNESNVSLPWVKDVSLSQNISSVRFFIQNTSTLIGHQFEVVTVKNEAKNNNGKYLIHHSENNFYAKQNGEIISDTLTVEI